MLHGPSSEGGEREWKSVGRNVEFSRTHIFSEVALLAAPLVVIRSMRSSMSDSLNRHGL